MKKFLISSEDKGFKANLNCHTNLSDGHLSPAELKKAYIEKGYNIIAFSDIDYLYNHSNLDDDNFLAITAYETKIYENRDNLPLDFLKCYSLTLYAKDENNIKTIELGKREYSQEYINAFIEKANALGFLVCINHPAKSLQNYADYDKLEGLFALEIADYNSYIEGHIEDPSHVYDRMIRYGSEKVLPLACDGNKNEYYFDNARCDSFGAWTVIKANKLEYNSVINALQNGDFYVSTGPEIKDVYCEDGKIHITCSPVRSIRLMSIGRDALIETAPKGELISEAVFDIDPVFLGKAVRIDVRDDNGNFAETPPYNTDELI